MTQSLSTDMIVPEVWADLMNAEFLGQLVLGGNGFTVQDSSLEGVPGAQANFPQWNALAAAAEIAEDASLAPEKFSADPGTTATIKEVGKAVEITDKALLVAFGDPLQEIRRQLGVLIARKIDGDLRVEAEAAGTVVDSAGAAISWKAFVDGIAPFGDQWRPDTMAGVVVHSKQYRTLLNDTDFISADKVGNETAIPRGVVGRIGGVPVYVSDLTTAATSVYSALLIRRNSLGLLHKRRPLIETDRDILARSTMLTTNVHYAVHALDPSGIVVLKTTEAA